MNYNEDLKNILRFWLDNAIDYKNGRIYTCLDREGNIYGTEKYFSVAYECFKGIRKTTPKINPESSSMKALSPVMIMLSTAQTMRAVAGEKYGDIARSA